MGDRAASVDLQTVQFRLQEMMEVDASKVRYVMYPGRQIMNQFVPWFFGVAFPFCFKYGVGMLDMPEWQENARHRGPAAPRVDLALWARIMTRRVESQFRRDWRFGFTMSSVLFQSAVNMARSVRLADYRKDGQAECQYSQGELERAAVSIVEALYGTYKDPSTGKTANVRGDFSKLKYVQSLDPIARRLAAGASAVARKIEGTNEVRTLMRYDAHAARIAHGVPLFFTMSPDERHNLIMVRMSRSRWRNPVNRREARERHGPTYGGLWEPAMEHSE